jgi:hypothetical protein
MDDLPQSVIKIPRGREMINYLGTLATIRVSDPSLNGRAFPVVKAFVDENKFLLDATERSGGPKWQVRYIKVSTEKITMFSDDGCAVHARAAVLANNRDTAFADAGLDFTEAWALDPRPEESVLPRCAFSGVPRLQERLNDVRAHGYPFQLTFGYFLFADMPYREITIGTTTAAVYSSEPIVLLKDCRGQLIDVSLDLEVIRNPSMPFHPRKIFVEDPKINYESVVAGMFALRSAREFGFLRGGSFEDRFLHGSEESPVALGMLPEAVDEIPENAAGCMVQVFKDGGLRGYEKDKKKASDYNITLANARRKSYLEGSTICSRDLFINVCLDAEPNGGRLVSADKFGNMCFACFIRMTTSESKMCGGCGKAVYCSGMCQSWHWKEHRTRCAPFEERKARRDAAAAAREKRASELARHDELVALQKAEEDAKEAVRKHHAMVARAERAEKEEREYARLQEDKPAGPSDYGQSHRGRNKKKMHVMTVEQKLVHGRWTSEQERQDRHEAATLRKQAAHLEAEARKAQKRVDKMKAKISHALKEQAEAAHAVPAPASVGEALAEAVQCVAIE